MKAYIARLNGEQKNPHEIVGFFVARSREQLFDYIDECCDVGRVEIMEIGAGGIYWSRAVEYVVPIPEDQAEDAAGLPGDATLTDEWLGALFDENEDRWEQILLA
jgi:hypothetical protein